MVSLRWLLFTRHVFLCREAAIQLRRDALPVLERNGVKLLCVSIGTPERAKDFVKETGFPGELLYGAAASHFNAHGVTGRIPQGTCFRQFASPRLLLTFHARHAPLCSLLFPRQRIPRM